MGVAALTLKLVLARGVGFSGIISATMAAYTGVYGHPDGLLHSAPDGRARPHTPRSRVAVTRGPRPSPARR